jgi:hypothetical protein
MKDAVLRSEYKEFITATKREGVGKDMMLEFCCDPESSMEAVGKELGLCIVRLRKERHDLSNPEVVS